MQDPQALKLVEHLLFKNEHFSKRVKYFASLELSTKHWEEEDYFAKHALFHEKFPDTFAPSVAFSGYYLSNICKQMVPVLETLCKRLVEASQNTVLVNILDNYSALLGYSDHLVTFVRDLFIYYHNHPALDNSARYKLLNLLTIYDNYAISKEMIDYFGQMMDSFSSDYIQKTLEGAAIFAPAIRNVQEQIVNSSSATQYFKEFASHYEYKVNLLLIEWLCLPFDNADFVSQRVNQFVTTILDPSRTCTVPLIQTLGLVFAKLPAIYVEHLFIIAANFIIKSPIMNQPTLLQHIVHEHATSMRHPASQLLILIHSMMQYASLDRVRLVKSCLQQVLETSSSENVPFATFFYCIKLFAPFVPLLVGSSNVIQECAILLLELLKRVTFPISCEPQLWQTVMDLFALMRRADAWTEDAEKVFLAEWSIVTLQNKMMQLA